MSCSYYLIVVIGYELVSYLLFYSFARCVTFKELFVCKSSTLMAYIEISSFLSSTHTSFSVKASSDAGIRSPNSLMTLFLSFLLMPQIVFLRLLPIDLYYDFPMTAFIRFNSLHNSSVLKVFNISCYPTAR